MFVCTLSGLLQYRNLKIKKHYHLLESQQNSNRDENAESSEYEEPKTTENNAEIHEESQVKIKQL